jgi:hypothetical protein
MSYVIIVLAVIALWHFIYESILLPSIRLHLRNRLFVLRDELRAHRVESDNVDEKAFDLVSKGINNYLTRLPMINIGLRVEFERKVKEDPSLVDKLKERRKVIVESNDESLKQIYHDVNVVLEYAFVANSGGWFIYLVPIAVLIASVKRLSRLAEGLLMLPTNAMSNIMPVGHKVA